MDKRAFFKHNLLFIRTQTANSRKHTIRKTLENKMDEVSGAWRICHQEKLRDL